jgi:hypothetical protein
MVEEFDFKIRYSLGDHVEYAAINVEVGENVFAEALTVWVSDQIGDVDVVPESEPMPYVRSVAPAPIVLTTREAATSVRVMALVFLMAHFVVVAEANVDDTDVGSEPDGFATLPVTVRAPATVVAPVSVVRPPTCKSPSSASAVRFVKVSAADVPSLSATLFCRGMKRLIPKRIATAATNPIRILSFRFVIGDYVRLPSRLLCCQRPIAIPRRSSRTARTPRS